MGEADAPPQRAADLPPAEALLVPVAARRRCRRRPASATSPKPPTSRSSLPNRHMRSVIQARSSIGSPNRTISQSSTARSPSGPTITLPVRKSPWVMTVGAGVAGRWRSSHRMASEKTGDGCSSSPQGRVEPVQSDLDRVRTLADEPGRGLAHRYPVEGGEGPAALLRQPRAEAFGLRRGEAHDGGRSRRRHAVSRRTVRRRTPGRPWRRRGARPARRSARPTRCRSARRGSPAPAAQRSARSWPRAGPRVGCARPGTAGCAGGHRPRPPRRARRRSASPTAR